MLSSCCIFSVAEPDCAWDYGIVPIGTVVEGEDYSGCTVCDQGRECIELLTGEPCGETPEPTEEPSAKPTENPTSKPTEEPTSKPTEEPTSKPTEEPTENPTENPTSKPSAQPVTANPTATPSAEPSQTPTGEGERAPSEMPSNPPIQIEDELEENCPPSTSYSDMYDVETDQYSAGLYTETMAKTSADKQCMYGGYRCLGFQSKAETCSGNTSNDLFNPEEGGGLSDEGGFIFCSLEGETVCLTASDVVKKGSEITGFTLTPGCPTLPADHQCADQVSDTKIAMTAVVWKGGKVGENFYSWKPDTADAGYYGGWSAEPTAFITPWQDDDESNRAGLSHVDICLKKVCPDDGYIADGAPAEFETSAVVTSETTSDVKKAKGESCVAGSECQSGKCTGKTGSQTCN